MMSQLLLGLVNGSFYAMLSLGLAVIFGLLNVINFSHGAMYMMGAFLAWMGLSYFDINYWAMLVIAPILVGLVGILIEHNLTGDRLSRTIVGIGVNVNQTRFDPSLPNPSSMHLETGCEYDRQEVLHRLGDCLAARYEQLEKGDREALQADYRRRMYRLGERHRYRYPDGRTVEAVLRGVRPSGELLLELPDGRTEGYLFREIEFVIEGKRTARTDGTGCVLKK